jgi:hypothetical protein
MQKWQKIKPHVISNVTNLFPIDKILPWGRTTSKIICREHKNKTTHQDKKKQIIFRLKTLPLSCAFFFHCAPVTYMKHELECSTLNGLFSRPESLMICSEFLGLNHKTHSSRHWLNYRSTITRRRTSSQTSEVTAQRAPLFLGGRSGHVSCTSLYVQSVHHTPDACGVQSTSSVSVCCDSRSWSTSQS